MGNAPSWFFGTVIAVTLLGLGIFFGAIGMATYGAPAEFLDSVSKIQGLIAAAGALIAAGIAYLGATAKVRSDEAVRVEEQNSAGFALLQELEIRTFDLLVKADGIASGIRDNAETRVIGHLKSMATIMSETAVSMSEFLLRAWQALPRLPIHHRDQVTKELMTLGKCLIVAKMSVEKISMLVEPPTNEDWDDVAQWFEGVVEQAAEDAPPAIQRALAHLERERQT